MMLDAKFRSRRWLLAVGVECKASAFLVFGLIDGGQWMAVSLAVLGMYGYLRAMEAKNDVA